MGFELALFACGLVLAGMFLGRLMSGRGARRQLPAAATPAALPAPRETGELGLRALGLPFDVGDVVTLAGRDLWFEAAWLLLDGAEPVLAIYFAPSQAGPSQAGPSQAGPSQAGPSQAGPSQAGPSQAGERRGVVDDACLLVRASDAQALEVKGSQRVATSASATVVELGGVLYRRKRRLPLVLRRSDGPTEEPQAARLVGEYAGPGDEELVLLELAADEHIAYSLRPVHAGHLDRWGNAAAKD